MYIPEEKTTQASAPDWLTDFRSRSIGLIAAAVFVSPRFGVGELSDDSPDDFEGLDASVSHVSNLLSTERAIQQLALPMEIWKWQPVPCQLKGYCTSKRNLKRNCWIT